MALTPLQLSELQDISIVLAEEFPSNVDEIWDTAVRFQLAGIGPLGVGGLPVFEAAVADLKITQEQIQTVQGRNAGSSSGYAEATIEVIPAAGANTVIVEDEGVVVGMPADTLDFVGAGVTVVGAAGLKTITIPGAAGQVNSVVGGTNISVNAGDPINPIVNLDAAITGVSVNAVTLSAVGAATNFLNETGAYSVPPAGSQTPWIADIDAAGFTLDDSTNNLELGSTGTRVLLPSASTITLASTDHPFQIGLSSGDNIIAFRQGIQARTNGAVSGLVLQFFGGNIVVGGGTASNLQLQNSTSITLNAAAAASTHVLAPNGVDFDWVGSAGAVDINISGYTAINAGTVDLDVDALTATTFNGVALTAAGAATNFLAEDGSYSVPPGGGGTPGGATTQVQFNLVGAFAGDANFVWDTVAKQLTISKLGGTGPAISVTNVLANTPIIQTGTSGSSVSNIPMRMYDNSGTQFFQWFFDTSLSAGNHKLELQSSTVGNTPFIEFDNSGEMSLFGQQNSEALLFTGLSGTKKMKAQIPLFFEQLAGPAASVATEGQFWVRNTLDGEPMFTDDAGVSTVLNVSGASQTPWTSDIDGDGFNLDDMGVIFMREQAASDPDVPTQGQIWVRDDSFANTLMFTTGQGNEFEVGGLPYQGDVLNGSLSLSSTTFGGAANIGPKPDHFYMIICRGQITTPDAADDGKVQLTVDTLSLFQGLYTDSKGQTVSMQSATGEVVTNTVVVDTDGSGVDDGTYFQIIGTLRTGASAQTVSLRVAKNANAGGNGLCSFPSISVIQLTE